jgi:hypothetical protein
MILSVVFNFVAADKRDPQSHDDLELLDIKLDHATVPLHVECDAELNTHLYAALTRLHDIMPK